MMPTHERLSQELSARGYERDVARRERDEWKSKAEASAVYAERLLDLLRRLYADHMEVEAASGFGIAPLIKREVEAVLAKNLAHVAGAIGTSQATVASTEHAEASGPGPQTPLEISEIGPMPPAPKVHRWSPEEGHGTDMERLDEGEYVTYHDYFTLWQIFMDPENQPSQYGTTLLSQDHVPRFQMVRCSACGKGFGPGNEGFSMCRDHAHLTPVEDGP